MTEKETPPDHAVKRGGVVVMVYAVCSLPSIFTMLVGMSSRRTAAAMWSGDRCIYLAVIVGLAWPRSRWTVNWSTPDMTRRDANVCRVS